MTTQSTSDSSQSGAIFLGTSGWAYPKWKPKFYPPKTPTKSFLQHYASHLNSVEVNYTFRQIPSRKILENWLLQVERDFRFSFKAPQRVTHIARLKDSAGTLTAFYDALVPIIEAGRMGLVLFQLPPNFKADGERLAAFLDSAARRTVGVRLAFEFRHSSWFADEVYRILRQYDAALCLAESDEMETPAVSTASFSCCRLRRSHYGDSDLQDVEERLKAYSAKGDVFAYFKHEDTPEGALNAQTVLERLRTK